LIGLSAAGMLCFENASSLSAAAVLAVVGSVGGLVGSLIDSFLGAMVQETLYSEEVKQIVRLHASLPLSAKKEVRVISGLNLLDNNQVNFISSLATSALCGAAALWFY